VRPDQGGGAGGGLRVVAEVHCGDEVTPHGEDMEDFGVGEDVALETSDELMDLDANLVAYLGGDGAGSDVGIELGPLARPVSADRVLPDDLAAFGCLGPVDVVGHQGECAVDVALIECGVRLLDGGPGVCHTASCVAASIIAEVERSRPGEA
jgi:hypothetical protein